MADFTKIKGQVWRVGHDVDTDVIIAARYLNTSDPEVLAAHCLEDLIPNILEKVKPGDILVAGKNFGCGSSREHAPIALKQAGFSCVIAESFARIFYRNAINIGLPIIIAPAASQQIEAGIELEVDTEAGLIKETASGKTYQAEPFPAFMLEILKAGGLVAHVKEQVKNNV